MPALVRQAKNNPVAYALIAAGLGWLIYAETRGAAQPVAAGKRRATEKRRTRRRKPTAGQVSAGAPKTFEIMLAIYIVLERHFFRDPLDRNIGLSAA